jgi:hypothetical protein
MTCVTHQGRGHEEKKDGGSILLEGGAFHVLVVFSI